MLHVTVMYIVAVVAPCTGKIIKKKEEEKICYKMV